MHPFLVLIIVAFGGAVVGLILQAREKPGSSIHSSSSPGLRLGDVGVGVLLGATAGLAVALGSENPQSII